MIKKKLTITKKAFKLWLELFTPRSTVGFARDANKCPLARYFSSINILSKNEKVVVCKGEGRNIGIESEKGTTFKSFFTGWMIDFVNEVDRLGTSKKVKAKEALRILG